MSSFIIDIQRGSSSSSGVVLNWDTHIRDGILSNAVSKHQLFVEVWPQ